MATRGQDIASAIKREINKFGTSLAMYDVGVVAEIGDGIARINGLASAKYNELLQFPNDSHRHRHEPGRRQRRGHHPRGLRRD